ncbi:TPA: hypothetical protein JIS01_20200, partial [Acinetobacter baumannii]|nr:hypothetical protein [Acinetobacter baumannii]
KLSESGFFADWDIKPENNLCTAGGDKSKVKAFKHFMEGTDQILVCTHATLRFAFEELEDHVFNNTLVKIHDNFCRICQPMMFSLLVHAAQENLQLSVPF